MTEEWRDIPGYEGLYQVSNTGKVKTLARSWKSGRGLIRYIVEAEKIQTPDKDGYPRITLNKEGKKTRGRVHQLVCLAFYGPCPVGLQIRHLDHTKTNNVLTNLLYGTEQENAQDRQNNPNYVHPRGMRGKKHSIETRKKMRQSHLNRKKEVSLES
jgi:hypothetical protein